MHQISSGSRKALPGYAPMPPSRPRRRRKGLLRTPAFWLVLVVIALVAAWMQRPVTRLEAGKTYQLTHFQKHPIVRVPQGGSGIGYEMEISSRFHRPIKVTVLRDDLTHSTNLYKQVKPSAIAMTADGRIGILRAEWHPGVMLPDPNKRSAKDWGMKK